MMNKRGGLLDEESMKVILAVAVFAGMVLLMVKLFAPVYSEADKTAESYLERLKELIVEADVDGSDSFIMLDNGDDKLNFYLVNFEGANLIKNKFNRKGGGDNVICVCVEEEDNIVCRHCEDLDLPAMLYDDEGILNKVVEEGVRMKIYERDGGYDFDVW